MDIFEKQCTKEVERAIEVCISSRRVILYYQYMRSERYMHKFALHFLIAVRNLLA